MDLFPLFLLALIAVAIEGAFVQDQVLEEETERREIVLGELGIFRNTKPFDLPTSERLISLLPDTREEIATEFRFFAPGSGSQQILIKHNEFSKWDIEGSGFKASAKTKFIIHGFLGGNAVWAVRLKDALIKKESCNVFIVDWTNGHGPLYEQAVANIRVVGAEVGLFIQRLKNATKLSLQNVHLIGHSLGSHASGYAGKWVQGRDPKNKIGRITGLDPAGPYFNEVYPVVRLDAGDAQFVDVIHTNWAGNRLSGFGLLEAIGHFDFYPNGGEDQPGCLTAGEASTNILSNAMSYISPIAYIVQWARGKTSETVSENIDALSCSHGRAYEFFIASLEDKDCEFKALQCFSWERYLSKECGTCQDHNCIVMGYYADRYKRYAKGNNPKKFYLRTTADYPFCIEKLNPSRDFDFS